MKTIALILISLILGLLSAKSQTITKQDSCSKVSVSQGNNIEDDRYYRSFTVLDMDNDYRIKVRFMENLNTHVQEYLTDQFGEENMTTTEGVSFWKKEVEEEEIYEVRLKGNRLRINVNKELASDKLVKRFKNIGEELKLITSR
ncbi:hypothetical protein [Aquimarina pacifica]|uniref:hypothetical protein n=1 Tax=Aquimarina pacifica TaxID=1296415 RepID=UPI00046FB140|nr:hypothetical protein [Aquimarina pacifica]